MLQKLMFIVFIITMTTACDEAKEVGNDALEATDGAAEPSGGMIDDVANKAGEMVDATKDAAASAAEAVSNKAGEMVDATKDAAASAGDAISEKAGSMVDATKDAASSMTDDATDVVDSAEADAEAKMDEEADAAKGDLQDKLNQL